MGSALVVALLKYGLLALLWLFVLVAVRTIRADLSGKAPSVAAPAPVPAQKAQRADKPAKAKKGQPRQLVVIEGALRGPAVTLGQAPVTLGRAHDSTLVLTDDYASNKHARLVPTEDGWSLEDLGSTNGTYVGTTGRMTKVARPTKVAVGSQVRIGKTVLELRG
jgi:pSer/pThr/pTyr-binding forkhead associated (FHA) protein